MLKSDTSNSMSGKTLFTASFTFSGSSDGLTSQKIVDKITVNKTIPKKKSDIPTNTLKLIEEAEKKIRSKLQSE